MKPPWTPILLVYCVLASSPENVFFVLGMVEQWGDQPLFSGKNAPIKTCDLVRHLNTWIYLSGRQARPTYFVRLLCSIALILVSLKSFWLGCSRRIRTLSPGYGPSMLPLHHHCDTAGVSSTPELYPNFPLSTAKLALCAWFFFSLPLGQEGRSFHKR